MKAAEKLMRELEEKGLGDRFADMQQRSAPKVCATLVGKRIEVLSRYWDENGDSQYVWAKGEVTGIPEPKTKSNGVRNGKNSTAGVQVAIITWDEEYLGKDKHGKLEPAVTS